MVACSDGDTGWCEPTRKQETIFIEKVKLKEKDNGHSCRSIDSEGEDITHTKEMTDGRLFLYSGESEHDYYQINNCPFCGYKAKIQIK